MNSGYRVATVNISYDILSSIFVVIPSGIANEHLHNSHQSKAFVKPWPVFQSVDGEFKRIPYLYESSLFVKRDF